MRRAGFPAKSSDGAIAVTNSAATTGEIPFAEAAGGVYRIPAGSSITSLTWYASEAIGGTFAAAYDEDGVAVTQTVSHTKTYAIPSALFGAASLKAVGDASGTIYVHLKA